jgi:uncharacterized membrane protein YkvA (DUF1232 family)
MSVVGQFYDDVRTCALHGSARWFGPTGPRIVRGMFLLPDLLRLLVNLIADTRVVLWDKFFVLSVLVYIFSPVDFVPEVLVGPFGLFEDLGLAVWVLYRLLGNPANTPAIQEHWQGDPQTMRTLQRWCQTIRQRLQRRRW